MTRWVGLRSALLGGGAPPLLHEEVALRVAAFPGRPADAPPEFVRLVIADALNETVLRTIRRELKRPYRVAAKVSWRRWADDFVLSGTVSSHAVALAGVEACRAAGRRPGSRRQLLMILTEQAQTWSSAAAALLGGRGAG